MAEFVYGGTSHGTRTLALEEGTIATGPLSLRYDRRSIPYLSEQAVRGAEFDGFELSLATFTTMVAVGDRRYVGIPVFPARYFRHRQVYVNVGGDIERPEQLAGRRVGVPDYHQTVALWVRGFLADDHGVAAESIAWVCGGLDHPATNEHLGLPLDDRIDRTAAPAGASLLELLADRRIDAVIAPRTPTYVRERRPEIVRLFPNYEAVERAYYLRTRIFPIMHLVVLKRDVYERDRSVAAALFHAFAAAKRDGQERERDPRSGQLSHPWWDERREAVAADFGGDLYPYGVEANRHVLETATRYAAEQRLTERVVRADELFAEETLALAEPRAAHVSRP